MFYTTQPTTAPSPSPATAACNRSADPYAAADAITHHHCDPDAAMADPEDRGPALEHEQPALHLLAGLWVASCPTCGFQLTQARSQARAERRAAPRCPVCHEVA